MTEHATAPPSMPTAREVGVVWGLVVVLGIAFTLFQLYISLLGGALTPLVVRAVHVGFVLALVFLTVDWRGRKRFLAQRNPASTVLPDVAFAALAVFACGYAVVHAERFLTVIASFPSRTTGMDLAAAGLLLGLIIEAARRTTSLSFALIALAVVAYALFGDRVPEAMAINPYTLSEILTQLYTSTVGFWGDITGVSAIEIGVLVLFAGVLTGAGGLDFLRNVAMVFAGRAAGGAGKVAVIMSALFGMISGSSAANVASVGSFTIPMLVRERYRREFAGGLEAASSTFGQLMPPIMGTGAFIMAELLNVSYARIMLAALLPSIAIYAAIYFATHFYAKRERVGSLPADLIANARSKLTRSAAAILLGPLITLIVLMVVGYSVPTAAFWAYVVTVVVMLFQRRQQPLRQTLGQLRDAMMVGVQSLLAVAVLIFAAQTLVTLVNMTGLGVSFTSLVTGSDLGPIALVLLTAFATLVLGMGLPTTAAYVIGASVTVPIMVKFGFSPLASHMFVFFFAILSAITPPVCVAVYVASAIAQANWLKVAWECLRISAMKYVLPFVMLCNTALLWDGTPLAIASTFVGVLVLAIALESLCFAYLFAPLSRVQGLLLAVACVALAIGLGLAPTGFEAHLPVGVAGLALFTVAAFVNFRRRGGVAASAATTRPPSF